MCQTGLISRKSKNVRNGRVSDVVRWFRPECDEEHANAYDSCKCRPGSPIPRDFSSLFTTNAGTLGKAQAQSAPKKVVGITAAALSCHGIALDPRCLLIMAHVSMRKDAGLRFSTNLLL